VIADRRYVIAKEIVDNNWLRKAWISLLPSNLCQALESSLFSKQEQESATRTRNAKQEQEQETATRTRNKNKNKKLSSYHISVNLSMDQVYSRNKNKNKTGNWVASSDSMRKEAWNCCRSSKGELQQWQFFRRFQVLRACTRSSTWILLCLCVCACVVFS
jgi:hypothetical protein